MSVLVVQAPTSALFEWAGECPAGCRYNTEWTAVRDARAWPGPHPEATWTGAGSPAFTIAPGESVRTLTGTVYTLERGTARMHQDFSTDASLPSFSPSHKRLITFRADEVVQLLLARGEGVWRIWRDGQVIDANLYTVMEDAACKTASSRCAGAIDTKPVTRWWVMVMNAQKQVGWVEQVEGNTGYDAGPLRPIQERP